MNAHLKLFSNPDRLRHLQRNLLTRLLEDLKESLPPQASALLTAELNHEQFCAAWAAQFSVAGALGAPLVDALMAIEALAQPENRPLLEDGLSHLPQGYDVNRNLSFLNQALHLWLIAQNTPGVIYPFRAPQDVCGKTASSPLPSPPVQEREKTPERLSVSELVHTTSGSEIQDQQLAGIPPHPDPLPGEREEVPRPAGATDLVHMPDQSKIENQNPKITDPETDAQAFTRLARLSPVEYDKTRRAEAKRLHLRLATLDDAVERARIVEDDAQANAFNLTQLKPWPEPVLDAPGLFDQVHERFLLYLHLPAGAAVVLTLWPPHAHAIAAFTQTPRLNLTSIEPGCGKTTVLELLATMTPKVMRTDNLKTAVLFRIVDQQQPTLLLDELDSYLHLFPELRGLLNAGNSPGACVYRCEGHVVRAFKAFAATALAGIGHLAPTLRDRSIVISLEKAPPGALQARFDKRHLAAEKILGRKIARWAQDNFVAIAACDPAMPPAAYNRLADNWRPLFAIAQVIGGHWPQRALDAFHALNPSSRSQPPAPNPNPTPAPNPNLATPPSLTASELAALSPAQSKIQNQNSKIAQPSTLSSQLLADLRSLFAASGVDRLFSTSLVAGLCALPDRPWSAENNGHKPINQAWLARQLRPFGLRPHNLRIGQLRAKGYALVDFAQAFDPLPPPPNSNGQP